MAILNKQETIALFYVCLPINFVARIERATLIKMISLNSTFAFRILQAAQNYMLFKFSAT